MDTMELIRRQFTNRVPVPDPGPGPAPLPPPPDKELTAAELVGPVGGAAAWRSPHELPKVVAARERLKAAEAARLDRLKGELLRRQAGRTCRRPTLQERNPRSRYGTRKTFRTSSP
jgi:hypothetical protein